MSNLSNFYFKVLTVRNPHTITERNEGIDDTLAILCLGACTVIDTNMQLTRRQIIQLHEVNNRFVKYAPVSVPEIE